MAYIDPRTSTRTQVTVWRVKHRVDGREKVRTFGIEKEAEDWRDLVNLIGWADAVKVLEDSAPDARPTVDTIVANHIEGLSGIEPGTRLDYLRDARRHIAPLIGGEVAATLSRRQVANWINGLEASGMSPKTIKNRHALLSAALKTAVTEGLIPSNVAYGVTLPEIQDAEMVFLEPKELGILLAHLGPHWRPLVTFLAGTGLRWAEATALRVMDVDLATNSLRVNQAWKHLPGSKRLGATKTRAGRRTVEYGPTTAAILEKACAGRPRSAYVFTNTLGRPVDHVTFHGTHWRPAVKAAMAAEGNPLTKEPRIHDLRHSYASWCLNDGTPIFVLSRVLGHKNAHVTTDRYGHLQPDRLSLAAMAAERALCLAA